MDNKENNNLNTNKEQDKNQNQNNNLDKKEFEVPTPERKSNDMTANDNTEESKRGSDGGKQSGKTSSTTSGNQQRGGNETYSNVNEKKEEKPQAGFDFNEGRSKENIEKENKKRRGEDNMIDEPDEHGVQLSHEQDRRKKENEKGV
jgi:hypothetical protein